MNENRKQLNAIIGLATLGSAIVGIVSFVAALVAFLNGDLVAVGVCLIASALSFGLLANALFRE